MKSFDYKTSITGKLEGNVVEKESVEIVVPLKYLSNFWRSLEAPLINFKVSLILTWYQNCVITGKATRDADPDADPAVAEIDNPTKATFKVKDTKTYVPVATLSTEIVNKLLDQLKAGFKRTIKRNKTNNISYLIDPTFTKFNTLFVLSFKNEDDRTSFSKYFTPSVEV